MKQPEIGRKISHLRKEKNLSQEELTDRCNVSVRTIQRIESGDVTPRSSTIRILLAALDYQYDYLKTYDPVIKELKSYGLSTFFLMKEVPAKELLRALQLSWIAGIIYFVLGIVEGGLEYSVYAGDNLDDMDKVFFAFVKLWVLVAYFLFARGFVALGLIFKNYLLRISAYILIGVIAIVVATDIFTIYNISEEELVLFISISEGITFGGTSILFGIALIRLQKSMGKISGYAGVLEMILGASFVTVIFFLIGFALMIPAIVLEVILLYKGYEFLKQEV